MCYGEEGAKIIKKNEEASNNQFHPTILRIAGEPNVGSFQNQGSSLYFNWNFSNNYKRFLNVNNILNFVFLGVFASGICFSIWKIACNNIGTVKTTSGLYLIPVVTIIFAFFVLDEKITSLNAIGSVITITGLFISGYKKKN